MIWLKRLAPFILIAVIGLSYYLYRTRKASGELAIQERYAVITAKVWVASARLRNNPEEFLRFRDSLLQVDSIDNNDLLDYINRYEAEPEKLDPFSRRVSELVDSLLEIEDSLIQADRMLEQDSITR